MITVQLRLTRKYNYPRFGHTIKLQLTIEGGLNGRKSSAWLLIDISPFVFVHSPQVVRLLLWRACQALPRPTLAPVKAVAAQAALKSPQFLSIFILYMPADKGAKPASFYSKPFHDFNIRNAGGAVGIGVSRSVAKFYNDKSVTDLVCRYTGLTA
jgi:hypothetical protein